jgi:hypothetical protein
MGEAGDPVQAVSMCVADCGVCNSSRGGCPRFGCLKLVTVAEIPRMKPLPVRLEHKDHSYRTEMKSNKASEPQESNRSEHKSKYFSGQIWIQDQDHAISQSENVDCVKESDEHIQDREVD